MEGPRMARRQLAGLLLAVALAAPATGEAGGPPAVPGLDATYDLYFGGIWLGDIRVGADYRPTDYRANATIRVAGLIGLFYESELQAHAEGQVDPAGLKPERFTFDSLNNSRRQVVEIGYANGSPASVKAEPAYPVKSWSIAAQDQEGAMDPLSAAVAAVTPARLEQICNQRYDVFDGRRRFAIEVGRPRNEKSSLVCDATYVRLAGFKPKDLTPERATWPLTVYVEPRADGLHQVWRVTSEMSFGLAVLMLRKQ